MDCETQENVIAEDSDARLLTLRLGCSTILRLENGKVTRRKEFNFTTQQEFWEFFVGNLTQRIPCWIMAHNIGFDLTVLGFWERIEDGTFTFFQDKRRIKGEDDEVTDLICLDDPPTLMSMCDKSGKRFMCVDTLNYWRTSLAALGEASGIPKMDMPSLDEPNEVWWKYCRRDVDVIETNVLRLIAWVKENDLGKFSMTSPSQAMSAFRHRFRKHDICFHDEAEVKLLERDGYYGGQVDNYYVGKVDSEIYQLDVNSIYPYTMKVNVAPIKLSDWRIEAKEEFYIPEECIPYSIAEVRISTRERTYPKRTQGGIIFPIGNYWTTLCGPELAYGFANGDITATRRWAVYDCANIFVDYVDFFWKLRLEYKNGGRKLDEQLAKLCLNSLYGKFGQRGIDWITCRDRTDCGYCGRISNSSAGCCYCTAKAPIKTWAQWCEPDYRTDRLCQYRSLCNVVQIKLPPSEHPRAFPAIAGWVTSHARQLMRGYREISGKGNVYYQAVDSLYVNPTGYKNLRDNDCVNDQVLGDFKLERKVDSGEFRGSNNYTVGDKQVLGSIKNKAEQVSEDTWKETHFQHLRSILSKPLLGGVKIEPIYKTLSNHYYRGVIGHDGWVTPLTLSEG